MKKVYLETPEDVIKALKDGKEIKNEDEYNKYSYKLVDGFIVNTVGNNFIVFINIANKITVLFHFLLPLLYGHQAGAFCIRVKIYDTPISLPVFSHIPIGLCSHVLHTLIYHSSFINHHIITPIIHSAKMIPILSNIMLICLSLLSKP